MTTAAAAAQYLAEHLAMCRDRKWAVYNPNNLPESELPVIYGFNNGGPREFLSAVAISQDGVVLGGHCCSHEVYMPHDLGVIEGSRTDRHEESYRKHYPNGYRMEFVGFDEFKSHAGLQAACKEHDKRNPPVDTSV